MSTHSRGDEWRNVFDASSTKNVRLFRADDWNATAASLQDVMPAIPDSLLSNVVSVYVSAARDTLPEVNLLLTVSPFRDSFSLSRRRRANTCQIRCECPRHFPE